MPNFSAAVRSDNAEENFNKRDLRETQLWQSVSKHFQDLISPSFGKVSDATDAELSPDGCKVSFTGSIWEKLEGVPHKRVCVADVATGKMDIITNGSNSDIQAKWSPNGKSLAYLSDRLEKGTFHLYVLDLGELREARHVRLPMGQTAESLAWSPTGEKILIGTAGQGADKAGGHGSGNLGGNDEDQVPAWMPTVQPDVKKTLWRKLWVYDVASQDLQCKSRPDLNIWESAWCGRGRIITVASKGPTESSWYHSSLVVVDASSGLDSILYSTDLQLGIPSASPSGSHVAFVEGLFSDRGVVAGTVKLLDLESKAVTILDTAKVDVSKLSWIDENRLSFVGLRGLHSVCGEVDIVIFQTKETWETSDSLGFRYPEASQTFEDSFAVVRSSWNTYLEIAVIQDKQCKTVVSLAHPGAQYLKSISGSMQEIEWTASDGTQIQGYLYLPEKTNKPCPLVVNVHGGPVWAWNNKWGAAHPFVPILVSKGYAVISPNTRGSKGRGDEFSAQLQYDMGGIDVGDILSGIDALADKGIVDPKRVGVTGGSYGGFMASWIITQTKRFAASVAVAPVTDWISQHTTSNIADWDRSMLRGDPYGSLGQYTERSPLRFVQNCSTPLLQLVGSEDQCTPPPQAMQMHNALVEHGIASSIVEYPGEGHGVKKFPAVIDVCVRMVAWFERYL